MIYNYNSKNAKTGGFHIIKQARLHVKNLCITVFSRMHISARRNDACNGSILFTGLKAPIDKGNRTWFKHDKPIAHKVLQYNTIQFN